MAKRPTVVCILGSTRHKKFILGLTQKETLRGNIVINHGYFHHVDLLDLTDEMKIELDQLMLHKIAMSDEILVYDMNGPTDTYIGRSTARGIDYAKEVGRPVRYYSHEEYEKKARRQAREGTCA